MKGLVALKKLLTFLVFSVVRYPAEILWRVVLCPFITVGYRMFRRVRKAIRSVIDPARGRLLSAITGKRASQALMIIIAVLITTNNIYANEIAPEQEILVNESIIATTSQLHAEDELVLEEADSYTSQEVHNSSYLSTHALSLRDYVPSEEELSEIVKIDDGPYDDTIEDPISHIQNAVRPGSPSTGSSVASGEVVVPATGPTRSKITDYTVANGESIGIIARKFGLNVTTILWANNLTSRSIIRPGQVLKILPMDGVSYTVKSGDTISAIARKYGAEQAVVFEANGLTDAQGLRVGEKLILPGAKPPAPPAPPRQVVRNVTSVFSPPSAANPDEGGELLWPAGVRRITQYYNWRHDGVDIAGPMRTPIYASADGTVIFSGWNRGGYGNMMIIQHGGGLFTRYAHATRNLASVGDTVSRGDVIQLMGSTGRSTGPHLHFEVMEGGIYSRVNPFKYIK